MSHLLVTRQDARPPLAQHLTHTWTCLSFSILRLLTCCASYSLISSPGQILAFYHPHPVHHRSWRGCHIEVSWPHQWSWPGGAHMERLDHGQVRARYKWRSCIPDIRRPM